jgi:DNA primase
MQHEADSSSLFGAYVNKLSVHGNEFRGCCPFHEDHSPSWSGNRTTGLWRCFGCGAQGNAYQFAARVGEKVGIENGYQQRKIVATHD